VVGVDGRVGANPLSSTFAFDRSVTGTLTSDRIGTDLPGYAASRISLKQLKQQGGALDPRAGRRPGSTDGHGGDTDEALRRRQAKLRDEMARLDREIASQKKAGARRPPRTWAGLRQ
jgi:hypothetical protein